MNQANQPLEAITIRLWLAGQAMQGLLSARVHYLHTGRECDHAEYASEAFRLADALLAEAGKEVKP